MHLVRQLFPEPCVEAHASCPRSTPSSLTHQALQDSRFKIQDSRIQLIRKISPVTDCRRAAGVCGGGAECAAPGNVRPAAAVRPPARRPRLEGGTLFLALFLAFVVVCVVACAFGADTLCLLGPVVMEMHRQLRNPLHLRVRVFSRLSLCSWQADVVHPTGHIYRACLCQRCTTFFKQAISARLGKPLGTGKNGRV